MRLIDADELMVDIKRQCDVIKRIGSKEEALIAVIFEKGLKEEIDKAPTVEPKRGRWIPVTNGRGGYECDQCHEYAPSYQNGDEHLSNFCPNCGADMRGEQDG